MSKRINIIDLSRIFEECYMPCSITNVKSSNKYVAGRSDPADYDPVCDINLALYKWSAEDIAYKFIRLGEALKKEMAEE